MDRMMKIFKTKSLSSSITEQEMERSGVSVSFLSFERAIAESEAYNGIKRNIKGYRVTEQGIEIILD